MLDDVGGSLTQHLVSFVSLVGGHLDDWFSHVLDSFRDVYSANCLSNNAARSVAFAAFQRPGIHLTGFAMGRIMETIQAALSFEFGLEYQAHDSHHLMSYICMNTAGRERTACFIFLRCFYGSVGLPCNAQEVKLSGVFKLFWVLYLYQVSSDSVVCSFLCSLLCMFALLARLWQSCWLVGQIPLSPERFFWQMWWHCLWMSFIPFHVSIPSN